MTSGSTDVSALAPAASTSDSGSQVVQEGNATETEHEAPWIVRKLVQVLYTASTSLTAALILHRIVCHWTSDFSVLGNS